MAGTEIRSITARQVYTNRGNPGVEAVVTTENGATGRAMCTSGISIGTHEIHFDFDGGERFRGKGVLGAVRNVNEIIAPALKGLDAANQRLIDRTMLDIVPDAKAKLGGNATAAVSAAVLKAGAAALGIPLYRHIGGANAMYLPVPGVAMVAGHERYGGGITTPGGKPTMSVMCFGFDTFADASYACWDIHTRWAEKMDRRFGGAPNIRDFIVVPEGVFKSDEEIWEAMTETIIEAGYEGKAGFQMDVATDTYHNKEDGKYYGLFNNQPKTKDQLYEFYLHIIKEFPFVILEDPDSFVSPEAADRIALHCTVGSIADTTDIIVDFLHIVLDGRTGESEHTVYLSQFRRIGYIPLESFVAYRSDIACHVKLRRLNQ